MILNGGPGFTKGPSDSSLRLVHGAVRFLLGAFEAGCFPGSWYHLSQVGMQTALPTICTDTCLQLVMQVFLGAMMRGHAQCHTRKPGLRVVSCRPQFFNSAEISFGYASVASSTALSNVSAPAFHPAYPLLVPALLHPLCADCSSSPCVCPSLSECAASPPRTLRSVSDSLPIGRWS